MFRKFLLTLGLLVPTIVVGQTVTVSSNVKTMFGGNATTKTKVCFSLVDGAGQQLANPRVVGTGTIVPTANQCFTPDGTGLVTTPMYANDQISDNGQVDTSMYIVEYQYNGMTIHSASYHFKGTDGMEDLNTKTPLSVSPAILPPSGDATYSRLDGGNMPFSGAVLAPSYRTSSSNPATVGLLRAASSDILGCFRNNVNNGNVCIRKMGAASNNLLSDALDFTDFGGVKLTNTTGIFTNSQMNLYVYSLLGGINPATEFHVLYGNSNNTTEGLTLGTAFPVGSTVFQGNILGTYGTNSGSITNAVAIFSQMRALVTGSHSWASNFVFDDMGFQVTGTGGEFDCNIRNILTTGACVQINGGAWTGNPNSYPALQIAKPSGGKWSSLFSQGSAGGAASTYFTSVDDASPEALNVDTGSTNNRYFTIFDDGNLGMESGWATSPNLYWWFQARNNLGANNTAYPIIFNPLGGNVGIGVTNPSTTLQVNGVINSTQAISINGGTSGTAIIQPPAVAGGIHTLPNNTGTISETNMPETFTASKTQGTNGTAVSIYQHKRISTGSIGATTRTEVVLIWANTFTDTNYTVTCNVEDNTTAAGTQGLTFERLRTKSATQIGAVINNPTAGGITGTLDCSASHD